MSGKILIIDTSIKYSPLFIIHLILSIRKDVRMEFIPYKTNECFEHLYYQIPMELFFNTKYKDKLKRYEHKFSYIDGHYKFVSTKEI